MAFVKGKCWILAVKVTYTLLQDSKDLHLLFLEKNCYISLRTASGNDILSIN